MINSDYIYRKIHKNVKKANLLKKDLPLKYDISNFKIVLAITNILQKSKVCIIKKAEPSLTLPVNRFSNYFDVFRFSLLSSLLLLSLPDLRSGICASYETWRLSIPERLHSLSTITCFMIEPECFYKDRTITQFFI